MGERGSVPTYLNREETQRGGSAIPLSNGQTGVIISFAIHALLVIFFLLQPTTRMAAVKTFHISFSGGESAPAAGIVKRITVPQASEIRQSRPLAAKPAAAGRPPTAPIPAKKTVTAPVTRVLEKTAVIPPAEATPLPATKLPPVSADRQTSGEDDFIAATGNVSRLSPPEEGAAASGAVQSGTGSVSGNASTGALKDGTGKGHGSGFANGSGNVASTGTGSGAPIETSFGAMNAPRFLHRVMPVYPPFARRQGKEGKVVLTLLIDRSGKLQEVEVTQKAGYGLTEAAIEAVRKSTFAPAIVNGQKVASRAVLPISFRLE